MVFSYRPSQSRNRATVISFPSPIPPLETEISRRHVVPALRDGKLATRLEVRWSGIKGGRKKGKQTFWTRWKTLSVFRGLEENKTVRNLLSGETKWRISPHTRRGKSPQLLYRPAIYKTAATRPQFKTRWRKNPSRNSSPPPPLLSRF